MIVRVVAFASAADVLGKEPLEMTLEAEASTAELGAALVASHPALEALWPRLALAVDGEIVRGDTSLHDGAEVALLPPVSGGAPTALATAAAPRLKAALVDGPIDTVALERTVTHPSCGAVVLFSGNVRDHHGGRQVAGLAYSAYRSMAEQRLRRIVDDLESADDRLRAAIVHRLGDVPIGEASVVIAVASPHREAAYQASRTALERLKREVPIWKRETYADGSTRWREEEAL